jgi:putative ABC transport system substrate-binding protein
VPGWLNRVGAVRVRDQKVARVGLLSAGSPTEFVVNGFHDGLRELGYVEGENLQIEYRWGYGRFDTLSDLAANLVASNVDVIVAFVTRRRDAEHE